MDSKCKTCGVELVYDDSRANNQCRICTRAGRTHQPRLKLYSCSVVWTAPNRVNSYFSILDTSNTGANSTLLTRLTKLGKSTSNIRDIEITEVEGPFEKGQILMEYV